MRRLQAAFLLLLQTVSVGVVSATSLRQTFLQLKEQKQELENEDLLAAYPPETCSCACCVVVQAGPHLECDVPKPSHWKHQACTFALCGDGHVLSQKGTTCSYFVSSLIKRKHCCITMNIMRFMIDRCTNELALGGGL